MATVRDAFPFKAQGLKVQPSTRRRSTSTSQSPIQAKPNPMNEVQDETGIMKFAERKHLKTDNKFEYERNGDDPGLILIFNQENFENMEPRKGTRRDVNEIVICFQRQGFNVEMNNIMTDFTSEEIRKKITEVAEADLSKYNCLIIFFLSHGDQMDVLYTRDGIIATDDIWKAFRNNKSLLYKPKMFIFQACKGDDFSTTGKDEPSSTVTKIVPQKTFSADYLYPDLLIVYATTEGNTAFRNTLTGTWFIQELCKNFSAYGKRDDVISLLIRTTKCVCGNYYLKTYNKDQKQMPFFVSTLRRKFYLNRNKERDNIIRLVESNEAIMETLMEIKSMFEVLMKEGTKKRK